MSKSKSKGVNLTFVVNAFLSPLLFSNLLNPSPLSFLHSLFPCLWSNTTITYIAAYIYFIVTIPPFFFPLISTLSLIFLFLYIFLSFFSSFFFLFSNFIFNFNNLYLSHHLYACKSYCAQAEYGHGTPGRHVTSFPDSTKTSAVTSKGKEENKNRNLNKCLHYSHHNISYICVM